MGLHYEFGRRGRRSIGPGFLVELLETCLYEVLGRLTARFSKVVLSVKRRPDLYGLLRPGRSESHEIFIFLDSVDAQI